MEKLKVGDKVTLSDIGWEYIESGDYRPIMIQEHFVILAIEKTDVDVDYFILNDTFIDTCGQNTGFFRNEIELIRRAV